MEGSIYASNSDSIWLSPFLMSKKLSTLNVFQETAGLIVHEMSHLLKANEDQANEIQNLFLNDIKNISPEMIAINLEYLVDDSGKGKVFETILPTTFS